MFTITILKDLGAGMVIGGSTGVIHSVVPICPQNAVIGVSIVQMALGITAVCTVHTSWFERLANSKEDVTRLRENKIPLLAIVGCGIALGRLLVDAYV